MSDTALKRSDFRFFHRLRVRWAEVDMQKVVFNAHYLMYIDTAMADYWRALALPYDVTVPNNTGALRLKNLAGSGNASVSMSSANNLGITKYTNFNL